MINFLDWSRAYPPQQEILEYVRNVAIKYNLYSKIKFSHRIVSAEWDDTIKKWHVKILNLPENREEIHFFDILYDSQANKKLRLKYFNILS